MQNFDRFGFMMFPLFSSDEANSQDEAGDSRKSW